MDQAWEVCCVVILCVGAGQCSCGAGRGVSGSASLVTVPEWPRGHRGFVLEALEEARPYARLDRHKRRQIQP